MTTLVFATNNQNKVDEIKKAIGNLFELVSLKDAGIDIDIPEPHNTLEENATEKSRTIYSMTGKNCFSEDTGLEVEGLNGEPGVKSARYSGEGRNFDANIEKVLLLLQGSKNRNARFKTVISLILNGEEHQFVGVCDGYITTERKGDNGFGYDAIFAPKGQHKTFGQMLIEEKNLYSHRKKATERLIKFLSTNGK
jgi:XTP/dITP diphosphohydrolase